MAIFVYLFFQMNFDIILSASKKKKKKDELQIDQTQFNKRKRRMGGKDEAEMK